LSNIKKTSVNIEKTNIEGKNVCFRELSSIRMDNA